MSDAYILIQTEVGKSSHVTNEVKKLKDENATLKAKLKSYGIVAGADGDED